MLENLYANNNTTKSLDPRGMFLVIGQDTIWQWVGKELIPGNQAAYQEAAQNQIELLQKHERAPQKVVTVYQGREDPNFWKCLNLPGPPKDAYR